MAQDIGRVAYQALVDYESKHIDNFVYQPAKWEQLNKVQQDAWRHAAVAVLDHIDWERKQYEEDLIG